MRTAEYGLLTVLIFVFVLMAASYMANAVASSMDDMANHIAEGSHHG